MVRVQMDLPESALEGLASDPERFGRELRLAAATKWYELGQISRGRAAEIAGLSRVEFINALNRYRVSPLQYGADTFIAEPGEASESEGVQRLVASGAGQKLRPGKPDGASVRFREGGPLVSDIVRNQRG